MRRDTDRDWRHFGGTNPYFGVLSHSEFDIRNITPETIEKFYATGTDHVEQTLQRVYSLFGQRAGFDFALDFGCGVGRLTLPLAAHCRRVQGIDVSAGMLERARSRAAEKHIGNVTFTIGDDRLSFLVGRVELIYSYIVFQHVPVDRGMQIFRRLIDALAPKGIGVIHLTFGTSEGKATDSATVRRNRRKHLIKKAVLNRLPNVVMRPYMQMNEYPVSDVLTILHAAGCSAAHLDFVDHEGELGAIFYFQKP